MTLRTRLALGIGAVLVTLVVAMLTVLKIEHDFVLGQLDGQLRDVPPEVVDLPDVKPRAGALGLPPFPDPPPVSNLFFGRIGLDGRVEPVLVGRLVAGEPAVTLDQVRSIGPAGATLTVEGRGSDERFRVLVQARPDGRHWGIIALPLTETDAALNRLALTLGLAAAIITAVLVVIAFWIVRLGLRPIARVTEAADFIGTGERGHRVAYDDGRTEAGRLGRAFNLMLDDRDAADARLRQFVADAAHELRTPLTSIRGYLDVHAWGGFRRPAEADDVARRLREESARMAELIEDLLFLASLDQARPLAHEPVDLADVLHDAAGDGRAVQPGRSLTVDVGDDPGRLLVMGDERRVREVIGELVHNALRHTPEDCAVVLHGHRSGDDIEVSVTDTGPGLTPEVAARVFDRFYRGDPSRARPTGGTGLGLAIAHAIVDAHHGALTLETAPGHGCRFHLRLPASGACPDLTNGADRVVSDGPTAATPGC